MTLELPSLKAVTVSLCVIIGCYSLSTFQRNRHWKDNFILWTDCVKKSPQKARPHNNLGNAYSGLTHYTQAIEKYQQALKRNPASLTAHFRLSSIYLNHIMMRWSGWLPCAVMCRIVEIRWSVTMATTAMLKGENGKKKSRMISFHASLKRMASHLNSTRAGPAG